MAIEYRAEIGFGGGRIKDKVFTTESEARAWAYDEGRYLTDVEYIEVIEFDGSPFQKKGESGMKINRKVADILAIINHMNKGLERGDEEFFNTDFTIGFGDTDIYLECRANYFNAFEAALGNLLCAVIEEEEDETVEPYASLYKQYEKYNKW